MKLTNITKLLAGGLIVALSACSSNSNTTKTTESETNTTGEVATEEVEETNDLGVYEGFLGSWYADAATAGVRIELTFNEDGTFAQVMGPENQEGKWVIVDDEHINITTPNTSADGQKWKVSDLTENDVVLTWNLDKKPIAIPMKRKKD